MRAVLASIAAGSFAAATLLFAEAASAQDESAWAVDTMPVPEPASPKAATAPAAETGEKTNVPLFWNQGWKKFGTGDWIVTGAGVAVAIGGAVISPLPRHTYGGVLFDDAVEKAVRVNDIPWRYGARDTSDVLLSLAATAPFLLDAMVTAWYQRHSPDVAVQMALMDAEAFAIAGALQETVTAVVSRERPYGAECGNGLPDSVLDCRNSGRFRSFFSGHSTLSFTAAGLTCMHHLTLHLFGEGPGDAIVCAGSFVLAGATATLRVVSDQHYVTDVIAGAMLGTAIGLAVPAFHYSGGLKADDKGKVGGVELRLVPTGMGASLVGIFR